MTDLPTLDTPAIAELAQHRRWVLHRAKRPITPSGRAASSTDPRTWSAYSDVCSAYVHGVGDGLGYVLTDTPHAGVDMDGCIRRDGALEPWAARIVERLASYTEVSPSGRGLHILVRGSLPGPGRNRRPVEVYDTGRYLTVTGAHYLGTPETIEYQADALGELYRELGGGQRGERSETHAPRPWDGALPESVEALAATDATTRLTLHKRHPDLGLPSPSEADWTLACRLVELGVGEGDVEAALRWRHVHTEPRPKSLDYFPRTARNAAARAGRKASRRRA